MCKQCKTESYLILLKALLHCFKFKVSLEIPSNLFSHLLILEIQRVEIVDLNPKYRAKPKISYVVDFGNGHTIDR